MNTITLYQPWASLCVLPGTDGKPLKGYETRGWKRNSLLGQRIAIHAGMKPFTDVARTLREALVDGYKRAGYPNWETRPLPFGTIVGSAVVRAFWKTTFYGELPENNLCTGHVLYRSGSTDFRYLRRSEAPFGDFSPGRWAWELADVECLTIPIPAKGKQGIWRLTDEQEAAYFAAEKVRPAA